MTQLEYALETLNMAGMEDSGIFPIVIVAEYLVALRIAEAGCQVQVVKISSYDIMIPWET